MSEPEQIVEAAGQPVSKARETAAWQTGTVNGIETFSKLHIWNVRSTRMLCGVAPGWKLGNFGSNHAGRCERCFALAAGDGLTVVEP